MTNLENIPEDPLAGVQCALEYSATQGHFHVDTLKRTLENNMETVGASPTNDYKIIFIGSYEECHELSEKLQSDDVDESESEE